MDFANPFGTFRVAQYGVWSMDGTGNIISKATEYFANSGINYGVLPFIRANGDLVLRVHPNMLSYYNALTQNAGYIGCYAEVLEDDE